jgi:hypothetical protein
MFHFETATRHDPSVDGWIESRPAELRALTRHWFEQMRRCGPDVTELLHDGCPVACVRTLAFGYVNAFTAHVNVGFFDGAALDDPDGLLEGTGRRMRHVKLRPHGVHDEMALQRLIEDAYVRASRIVNTD